MSDDLAQVEALLPRLTVAEKSELLARIATDLSDISIGIESHPDVCGGEPRIVRTRIPVWLLEQARRLGKSEAELLAAYPSLRSEDLTNAWAYVRNHGAEIERQIEDNEAA